jgi:hypothetical protein
MQYTVIPAEQFVRTWQMSNSVGEVANKLGKAYNVVRQRAYVLRKAGVNLKTMPPMARGRRLDVEALNCIAQSSLPSNIRSVG